MPRAWLLPREVVLYLLLAELIASYEGRGRPTGKSPRPAAAPAPRHPVRAGHTALCGRRPRG
ncbi:MAG TPA: hypothetical protein VF587_06585 [Solirubrobacteraceae bacterium]